MPEPAAPEPREERRVPERSVPEPGEEPRVRRVPSPRHVPSEERRAALRERVLAMRAKGMTLQEIADELSEEGEVTPGGGRQWHPWTVRAATRPIGPQGRSTAPDRRGGR